MSDDVKVSRSGRICELRFDRPARKNAITSAMYNTLADAFEQAAADNETHVALLCGSESIFTAGNDVGDFLNRPPQGEEAPAHRFLHQLSRFPKPLVAAVCGPAVGIGTTMLLHCDLVYAGDNARLSLPFVNLGLCPEAASSLLLPAIAGYQRAAEKLLLGEAFGAEEAHEMGLVNRVLPAAEAEDFARAQAAKLASRPLASLLETKALMKGPKATQVREAMDREFAVFARLLGSKAAREAVTAFLEKRAPDFSRAG